MLFTYIVIGLIALGFFATVVALISRYKKCPSDKLLVVYGKTGKNADGMTSTARVHHGGGAFIWPVIQDYQWLSLKPIAIDVDLRGALSKQNIRIDVPSTFTIAVSTDPNTMINAAERLLGMQSTEIATLSKDIILGQLRLVIATMDIEEINADRDKFLTAIQNNLESELDKVGLRLINVNITDIQDESGYIKALGQEAASKAINDAKVSVAEKTRDGAVGSTAASKDERIQTSQLRADAEVGEAQALMSSEIGRAATIATQRSQQAELNATAVSGENEAAIKIADTTALRKVAEAEASKKSTVAENVAKAEAEKITFVSETQAEQARADKSKATLYANEIVPAEIAKQKKIVEAEGEAESIRSIAKGDADALLMAKTAEAEGIAIILEKQAEGLTKFIEAAGGNPDKALQLMIVDKLPELMKIQMDAIANIKIDKITVWDNGGEGSEGSTAGFLKSMLGALPAYDELYKSIGKSLPGIVNIDDVSAAGRNDSTPSEIAFEEVK